jgi:hypothetical protein
LGNENDGINKQSGNGFEKLYANAPHQANTQKDPYKIGLTGLYRRLKYQSFFFKVQPKRGLQVSAKLSTINGSPGLSSSVLQLYLTLTQPKIIITAIINRLV